MTRLRLALLSFCLVSLFLPIAVYSYAPCVLAPLAQNPHTAQNVPQGVRRLPDSPGVGTLGTGQADAGSDVLGGELYMVGGYGCTPSNPLNAVSVFSPSNMTWRAGPNYPVNAWGVACAGVNNVLYCFGGEGSGLSAYKLNGFALQSGWSPIRTLPSEYADTQGQVAVADPQLDRVYILGSSNPEAASSTLVYNVSNDSYTRKSDMPFGNRWFSAVVYNGDILTFGGFHGSQDLIYEISGNKWTISPVSLPGPPRLGMVRNPGIVGGLVPLVDGMTYGKSFYSLVYFYNLTSGGFIQGPGTLLARDGIAGGVVGNEFIIAGGRNVGIGQFGLVFTEELKLDPDPLRSLS